VAQSSSEVLVTSGAFRAATWFFENSLDVFISVHDDVLKSANAAWSELTGWAPDEVLGRSFASMIHPDDAEAALASVAPLGQDERCVIDYRLATKAGGWRWVSCHAVRGEQDWLLAILRDVTVERARAHHSQQALQAAAMLRETAGVTIWRYDPTTDEYDLDPDFTQRQETTGSEWKRAGASVRPEVHRQDARALHDAWTRSLITGEPQRMNYRERLADGGWRHVQAAWRGVRRLPSGQWEMLGIAQDVTPLVEARDAAVRGERAALAAVEAEARFLANVSHEIRTPMNGVLGALHLLTADPPRNEQRRLVREALASGAGLSDLLNDLIDYADVEAGHLELRIEPTEPANELESVLAVLRPKAVAKGLTLQARLEGDLGWVRGDPGRLRKMFFHLIGNAVKFTNVGGVDIVLSQSGEGETRRLRLDVVDTGIGIPAAAQRYLFERFHQADASMTRRHGGAGMGLAISKRLTELMGGSIGHRSVEGRGSAFWFDIAAPACAEPVKDGAPDGGWLSGLRILVVEDNPTNRLVATTMLSQLGAQVETAEDGAQGVAAVKRSHFDLVFMDIQMPVMDGVEAAKAIRELPAPRCDTPIVATTANVMPDQLASYRRSGMNGVIAKPISPQLLLAEVARVAAAAQERERQAS